MSPGVASGAIFPSLRHPASVSDPFSSLYRCYETKTTSERFGLMIAGLRNALVSFLGGCSTRGRAWAA